MIFRSVPSDTAGRATRTRTSPRRPAPAPAAPQLEPCARRAPRLQRAGDLHAFSPCGRYELSGQAPIARVPAKTRGPVGPTLAVGATNPLAPVRSMARATSPDSWLFDDERAGRAGGVLCPSPAMDCVAHEPSLTSREPGSFRARPSGLSHPGQGFRPCRSRASSNGRAAPGVDTSCAPPA